MCGVVPKGHLPKLVSTSLHFTSALQLSWRGVTRATIANCRLSLLGHNERTSGPVAATRSGRIATVSQVRLEEGETAPAYPYIPSFAY